MAYRFILTNSTKETVVAKLYDWNDGSWAIPYKTYKIKGGEKERLYAADNVVMQIGLFKADGKTPCEPLGEHFMNFYATQRDWTVVYEKDGDYWNIVKTNPEI